MGGHGWACNRPFHRVAAQTFLGGAGQRFCSSPNIAALCGGDRQRRQAAASAAPRSHARHRGEFLLLCLRLARSAAAAREGPGQDGGRGLLCPGTAAAGSASLGTKPPAAGGHPGKAKLFMTETRPGSVWSGNSGCAWERGGQRHWGQGHPQPVPPAVPAASHGERHEPGNGDAGAAARWGRPCRGGLSRRWFCCAERRFTCRHRPQHRAWLQAAR